MSGAALFSHQPKYKSLRKQNTKGRENTMLKTVTVLPELALKVRGQQFAANGRRRKFHLVGAAYWHSLIIASGSLAIMAVSAFLALDLTRNLIVEALRFVIG